MANYCSNSVEFSGPLPQLAQVRLMFAAWQAEDKVGMPDFIAADHSYMFDVYVGEQAISFETRWVPNLDIILQIAEHFELDYIHRYEETAMFVYGEASRKDGGFSHVFLESKDLREMSYDPEQEAFLFRGGTFHDDFTIWMQVLKEKKALLGERGYLFQTESYVSREHLTDTFGELGSGDFFLKLAEYKNFNEAEKVFKSWDEHDRFLWRIS